MEKISFINLLKVLNRCRIHRREPEFIDHVLNAYRNPDYLHLETRGDEYAGQTIYHVDEQGNGVGFFAEEVQGYPVFCPD